MSIEATTTERRAVALCCEHELPAGLFLRVSLRVVRVVAAVVAAELLRASAHGAEPAKAAILCACGLLAGAYDAYCGR